MPYRVNMFGQYPNLAKLAESHTEELDDIEVVRCYLLGAISAANFMLGTVPYADILKALCDDVVAWRRTKHYGTDLINNAIEKMRFLDVDTIGKWWQIDLGAVSNALALDDHISNRKGIYDADSLGFAKI